jgi:glutaredoxin 3
MENMKLYVGTNCRFCKKVEDFLQENNIEIETVNINENREEMMNLVKNGGKRQVPCLEHDGVFLYESNDIIEYLKNNH